VIADVYIVVYHYKIPIDKTIGYFKLEKKAIEAHLENGCVNVEIYRDSEDPQRWMEINRFRDKEHYQQVASTLNDEPRKPLISAQAHFTGPLLQFWSSGQQPLLNTR